MTWPLQMHTLESCNVLNKGYKKLTLFISCFHHKNFHKLILSQCHIYLNARIISVPPETTAYVTIVFY